MRGKGSVRKRKRYALPLRFEWIGCHCYTSGKIDAHIVVGRYHRIKYADFARIYLSHFTKNPGNRKHIKETIKTNSSPINSVQRSCKLFRRRRILRKRLMKSR